MDFCEYKTKFNTANYWYRCRIRFYINFSYFTSFETINLLEFYHLFRNFLHFLIVRNFVNSPTICLTNRFLSINFTSTQAKAKNIKINFMFYFCLPDWNWIFFTLQSNGTKKSIFIYCNEKHDVIKLYSFFSWFIFKNKVYDKNNRLYLGMLIFIRKWELLCLTWYYRNQ